MDLTEVKVRILFVMFVQSVIWSLSTSVPIKTDQLSGWNDEDHDAYWFRRFKTPRPFVRITLPPFLRKTLNPKIWNRFTIPPIVYKKNINSNNNSPIVKAVIIVPIVLIGALIACCKYVICGKGRQSTSGSRTTIHPPPSWINLPPENRAQQTFQNRSEFQNSMNPNGTSQGGHFDFSTRGYETGSSTSNFGDKPPGYSDVVFSDSIGGNMKFPGVSPKPPDSPPPKYEDKNLTRY